jgi:hypothetical protein
MAEYVDIYPWSRLEARRLGETRQWDESFQENCRCAKAIKNAIAEDYKDNHLDADCAKRVIEVFGFDRVRFVLSNTFRENESDGRYSQDSKDWAKEISVPKEDHDINKYFCVDAHPGLTDIFALQSRRLWRELGLFDKRYCLDNSKTLDYTGKILVIDPSVLHDEYKKPDYQLFYASGGNGCRPDALGTKVFGQYLKDGEKSYLQRSEIVGVIKPAHLPEWAEQAYKDIISAADQTEGISMGGIQ